VAQLHDDDIDIDIGEGLVRELLEDRRPEWLKLPLSRILSAGTSNALYRLGADMVVRLPRTPGSAVVLRKEQEWLPRINSATAAATAATATVGAAPS
jgi:aminoglycoside phosphotransferase (APT) family kinase protein